MSRTTTLVLALVLLVAVAPAQAHRPSDSYLTLDEGAGSVSLVGHWDIHLRDLDYLLALDSDGDGELTWAELRTREGQVAASALATLQLERKQRACALSAGPLAVIEHSDGAYARLPLQARCPPGSGALTLRYGLLAAQDPSHRAILRLAHGAETRATYVLGVGHASIRLPLAESVAVARGFLAQALGFVWQGMVHIFEGIDHVLFLLVLLLPAVLLRRDARWQPAANLRQVLLEVAKIVTAFTVAHSLTLSLAALGVLRVSSSVIEPAIAASVTLAAANNLYPVLGDGRWVMAFALGLLHGFGFSSALADAGLGQHGLLPALLGFNVGVELGQLLIVGLFVPCAFFLRRSWAYRRLALTGGSLLVLGVSLLWFVQRLQVGS